MKPPRLKDGVLAVLALLAVAQIGLLTYRQLHAYEDVRRRLGFGDSVAGIQTLAADGGTASLATGRATLLMVFHSECVHCERVAPAWAQWLSDEDVGVDIVAVSNEPFDVAAGYAAEKGWDVAVKTVSVDRLGDDAHALTSRTPWLFLIGPGGTIEAEGHGEGLAEMAAVIRESAEADLSTE
jgi:thiol-disulfide isomerase/thioredoxin